MSNVFKNCMTLDALKYARTERQMFGIGDYVHTRQSEQVYVNVVFRSRATAADVQVSVTKREM
jgi:hypothetical protein